MRLCPHDRLAYHPATEHRQPEGTDRMDDYDVVVVGGSLAGCSRARLLALRGARVALIEKRPALDAYKVTCTHYIQAGASPAIERLGSRR
jgi:glycine/D-amino acid oxidase-like deaminating enzyme